MKALIYDLDGTLVDSAKGILESLRHAFSMCGVRPARLPSVEDIGPPILDMCSALIRPADVDRLDDLLASFKVHYDTEGFRKSRPYPGICNMLSTLTRAGMQLSIVTNKRTLLTRRLVALLGLDDLFQRIYSIDSFPSERHTKAGLLKRLLCDEHLEPCECSYVGDRLDDARAAIEVGLRFFYASWRYGGNQASEIGISGTLLATPTASLSIFAGDEV